jgi:Tol biopolymer transport system component
MKQNYLIIIIILTCILILNSSNLNAQTIAFQRSVEGGDEIWIADKNGENLQLICKGMDPDISPDGKYIAFTASNGIGYVNIKTKEIHIFKSIRADRSFGPKWSPNSDMIAFMCLIRPYPWGIGVVDLEDTYFHILTEGSNIRNVWAPTWDLEGKYVLCRGDGNILKIDLNGNIISKIPYKNIDLTYGIANGTRLSLSSDGNYLLFDAMVENETINGLHEPPITIFIHNLLTGKTTRVTPAGICALRPCWVSDSKIIFEGFIKDDITGHQGKYEYEIDIDRAIYSIDIDGKNLKKLIENGWQPSFSNSNRLQQKEGKSNGEPRYY